MREPKELIKECKKHLRYTKQYQHEYKKDIRKLITALEQALTIPVVGGSYVSKKALIDSLQDTRILKNEITEDMWYYYRKETADYLLNKYEIKTKQ